MLCVEDQIDALKWTTSVGGLKGLIARSESNLKSVVDWVAKSSWCGFLAEKLETRSSTSICLKVVAPWFAKLSADDQAAAAKKIASVLEKEGVAFDIGSYRDAPPGLRIWGGATVENSDIVALLPWLDWAFAQAEAEFAAKA
jgi:phosphoserine aminotransferase